MLETTSWELMQTNLLLTIFDRQVDLEVLEEIGFKEERAPDGSIRGRFSTDEERQDHLVGAVIVDCSATIT